MYTLLSNIGYVLRSVKDVNMSLNLEYVTGKPFLFSIGQTHCTASCLCAWGKAS
jgi:hypothetical protein